MSGMHIKNSMYMYNIQLAAGNCAGIYLRVLGIVVLLRPNPPSDELVAHRVRCGLVEVVAGGYVAVLHDCLMEVTIERRLDSCHVLQLRDIAHGDLFLSVARALRVSHG